MNHERKSDSGEKDVFFRLVVIGIAVLIGGIKMRIDKYIADANVACLSAGMKGTSELSVCVNRKIYGALYPEVPDFLFVNVEEMETQNPIVAEVVP